MTAPNLQGLHLHFDAPSGAAGDMIMGALLDLGVPESVVRDELQRLVGVGEYELTVARAKRGSLMGTDVHVRVPEHHHHDGHGDHAHHEHDHHDHRHYDEIRAMLQKGLSGPVLALSLAIFDKVAVAEAKLHGVSVDHVAFHEVGAVDSIVDIVGAAAAIAWLRPSSVSATALPLGHGMVKCAHGLLPVPAPATLEICRAAGVPTIDGGVARELLTPTGAAILASIVQTWGAAPAMHARAIGYGAGDAELADRPNLLRATVGERAAGEEEVEDVVTIEANLDDMNPELCEHVAERLFEAGALDVWWTPVVMKKSRPAVVLGVLAPAAREEELGRIVLTETTTLGYRVAPARRQVLERKLVEVQTPYGVVPVKVGLLDGQIVNRHPEYEVARKVAKEKGVALKEVLRAALAACD